MRVTCNPQSILGDMLAHKQLPERLIEHCLDILTKISPTERELIRVVVEVVLELRDEDDNVGVHDDGDNISVGICLLIELVHFISIYWCSTWATTSLTLRKRRGSGPCVGRKSVKKCPSMKLTGAISSTYGV